MDFPKPMGSKLTRNAAGILNFKKSVYPEFSPKVFSLVLQSFLGKNYKNSKK